MAMLKVRGGRMDQQIWLGIVESERYYRYYHSLSQKLHQRQWYFDLLLVPFIGGIAAALASHFLQGPSQAIAFTFLLCAIGAIVMWQQVRQYAVKATAASMIALQYKALSEDWRRQWHRSVDDDVLIAVLTERLNSIAGQHDLPFDERLSAEAEDTADKVISGEFRTAV